MNYLLPEGGFKTAIKPLADRSVNVLMFEDQENKNIYSIMINRDQTRIGETLIGYCERQLADLTIKLKDFKQERKLVNHRLGNAKLPIVQVVSRHKEANEECLQVQTVVQLPSQDNVDDSENVGADKVLVFTLSSNREFTEAQRKHYVQLINSFIPANS
ncbi:DcrB-related protein [Neisseriaceae bacterium TC5R-5]|nr:DcrB-related protein [Neisseriaceae bacterium TC5R-5]